MKRIILIVILLVILIGLIRCKKDTPVGDQTIDTNLKPVAVQVVVDNSPSSYIRIY